MISCEKCANNRKVWQFRVKIEYYYTMYMYFNCRFVQSAVSLNFPGLNFPVKGGAQMCCVVASIVAASTQCV